MAIDENKILELLKKAFDLPEIQQETYIHSFFSGRAIKYLIPKEKLESLVKEFPFMKNAVKAGLFSKDKKTGNYFITSRTLNVKSSDKRKSRERQFFSINGDDDYERTTLYDILYTIENLRYISKKFGVPSNGIKFTIRHENGNPEKVVNYVELDKRIFGNNEDEIKTNINKLNNLVQYERKNTTNEAANV